ncbi:hypothetical protein Hanom_Chr07g00601531 [Helianthus anomalus]
MSGEIGDTSVDSVEVQSEVKSPAKSPEFSKLPETHLKESKGLFSNFSPTCMGNSPSIEILHVCIQKHAEADIGIRNSAVDCSEERENIKGVGPSGSNGGLCSDPEVGLGDFGPSVDLNRPSYITMRSKKSKAQDKDSAQVFKTPDLNNSVGKRELQRG